MAPISNENVDAVFGHVTDRCSDGNMAESTKLELPAGKKSFAGIPEATFVVNQVIFCFQDLGA